MRPRNSILKTACVLLFASVLQAQSPSFTLSTTSLVLSASAGNASVELLSSSPTAAWIAYSNATWLHVSPAYFSGTGSTLIEFTYDANANGGLRTGTLAIAGLTLNITQAGNSFVTVSALTPLVAAGLDLPYAVALDANGNIYIADSAQNTVQEWVAATGQLTTIVSTGLNAPHGVAVDGQGNVYIADAYNNAIKQWSPVSQQVVTLVSSGLNFPLGVAVDGQGNLYIADFGNNAIEEWNRTTQQLTRLVSSGLNHPTGVALDAFGNLYIADLRNNQVKEWNALTSQITVLISQGLSFPNALTVDSQGNVYLIDGNNDAIKQWSAATQSVTTLATSGVNGSFGIAIDGQGSLYLASTGTSSILKLSSSYVGLATTSLNEPAQAGTDSASIAMLGPSVPFTATSDQSWLTINGITGSTVSFSFQANTSASSRVAHIIVLGQQITVTQSADVPGGLAKTAGDGQSTPIGQPFPILLEVTLTDVNGVPVQGASVTFSIIPAANGAGGTFGASPPIPVLTDQNGNAIAPPLTANAVAGSFTVSATVNSLSVNFSLTNTGSVLASNAVLVGGAAGNGTVLLVSNTPWTATSNAPWLQIAGSASGTSSTVIQFTYGANPNAAPRVGTLSISGVTFTVTQAGTNYLPVTAITPLISSGLNNPQGVAVDALGNLYIADTGNNAIKQWNATTQQVSTLSTAQNNPKAVAVDTQSNIYIADTGNNAIEEYTPANQQLNTLVMGLGNPSGVAVDGQGNVYFSDTANNAVTEWSPESNQSSVLVNTGVLSPTGIAVDALGNVDFADSGNNAIRQWAGGVLNSLVAAGLNDPTGIAVDGQGNVYLADTANNAIKEWNAGSQQVATLASGFSSPSGVAVDAQANVYVADTNNNAVEKLTPAWLALSATSLNENYQAGSDAVNAQVLPANTQLTATSDQPWLTITGSSGGVISFSFQANIAPASRIAHITVLGIQVTVTQSGDTAYALTKCGGDGQSTPLGQPFAVPLAVCVTDGSGNPLAGVPVTFSVVPGSNGAAALFAPSPPMPVLTNQSGTATAPPLTANTSAGGFTVTSTAGTASATFSLTNVAYSLGSSSLVVGSGAGAGSVYLSASGPWTATSSAPWLQLAPASASGSGNALIQFAYGANTNAAAQTGSINIAGLTFTVTQAGASYTAGNLVTTLVSSGLKDPQGLAIDSQGNVYIADTGDNAVKQWNAQTQQLQVLVASGLNAPTAVAVDTLGNVYIADRKNNAIKQWNAATGSVTALVSTGLSSPEGVAVDSQGNVYFSDANHNAIKEWTPANNQVSTLVSTNLNFPQGVAVDAEGNVYFADSKNNAIKEWTSSTSAVTTLVSSGLNAPSAVSVDGGGNVYIADTGNNALKLWSPTTGQVTQLLNSGLTAPGGVAANASGSVYVANSGANSIKTYTAVYVSLGALGYNEQPTAGSDSLPIGVLPANAPITATRNASWVSITGTTASAIRFSYQANTSIDLRSSQITVLGQSATVTQLGDLPVAIAKTGGSGQKAAEGQAFGTALQVRLKDASGNGISQAPVVFTITPGAKGASATFSSSPTVVTSNNGTAISPQLTANNIAGTFTVTASIGALSTSFTLTVTAP